MKVFSIRYFVIWVIALVIGAVVVFGALNVHADFNTIPVVISGNYSLGYQLEEDLAQEIKEYMGIADDEQYTAYNLASDFISMYVGATTGLNTDLVNLMIETIGDYWVGLPSGKLYIDRETGLIHYPDGTYELIEQFYEEHGMNQPTDASNFYYIYNSDNTTQSSSYYFYVTDNTYGIRPFSATHSAYMAMYYDSSGGVYYMVVCSLSDEPFSINVRRRRLAYSQNYLDSMSLNTYYNGTSTSGYYGVYSRKYVGPAGLDMSLCMFDSLESALSTFYGIGVIVDNTPTPNGDVYIIPESALDEQQFNVFNLRGNDGLSRTVQRNTDINNGDESDENWLIVPEYNNIPYIADLNDIPNNHNFKYQYPVINDDEYTFDFDYDVDTDNSTIIKDVGDALEPTGFLVSFFSIVGVFILLGVIL